MFLEKLLLGKYNSAISEVFVRTIHGGIVHGPQSIGAQVN